MAYQYSCGFAGVFNTATSSQNLPQVQYRYSARGGMCVHDIGSRAVPEHGGGRVASLSGAFNFVKRSRLEEKFGRLAPSDCAPLAAQSAVSYKRDPDERLERRIERKASQDALRERYKSGHEQARKIRALAELVLKDEFMASDRDRMSDHDKLYKSCRAEIRADDSLTLIQKQQAYMLAKLSHAQTRVQLRDQVRAERALRRELLQRLPTWREWVENLPRVVMKLPSVPCVGWSIESAEVQRRSLRMSCRAM